MRDKLNGYAITRVDAQCAVCWCLNIVVDSEKDKKKMHWKPSRLSGEQVSLYTKEAGYAGKKTLYRPPRDILVLYLNH